MTDEIRVFEVGEDEESERLDVYLTRRAPEYSRSRIQKLIDGGRVTLGGKLVKANYKVQPGNRIELAEPEVEPLEVVAEDIPLDILFEDSDVVVINKPRGMVVHPAAGNYQGTLVNALLEHCQDLSGIGGVARPGIVHRLDKDTSGVMMVAKTDRAHLHLAKQIKDRTASRKYIAIVHGNVQAEQGLIDAPIGRHPVDRKKMAVNLDHGKEAKTKFRVLERFGNYSVVECRLMTGRTHQIRVHMAYIGHPVVGDPKYGPRTAHFSIEGQALHSAELAFQHPVSGQELVFEAPLPADMEAILCELRARA